MQQQITRPAAIPPALIIVERLYALHYNKFKLFQQVSHSPQAHELLAANQPCGSGRMASCHHDRWWRKAVGADLSRPQPIYRPSEPVHSSHSRSCSFKNEHRSWNQPVRCYGFFDNPHSFL